MSWQRRSLAELVDEIGRGPAAWCLGIPSPHRHSHRLPYLPIDGVRLEPGEPPVLAARQAGVWTRLTTAAASAYFLAGDDGPKEIRVCHDPVDAGRPAPSRPTHPGHAIVSFRHVRRYWQDSPRLARLREQATGVFGPMLGRGLVGYQMTDPAADGTVDLVLELDTAAGPRTLRIVGGPAAVIVT